jgi:hypothetical protein
VGVNRVEAVRSGPERWQAEFVVHDDEPDEGQEKFAGKMPALPTTLQFRFALV